MVTRLQRIRAAIEERGLDHSKPYTQAELDAALVEKSVTPSAPILASFVQSQEKSEQAETESNHTAEEITNSSADDEQLIAESVTEVVEESQIVSKKKKKK